MRRRRRPGCDAPAGRGTFGVVGKREDVSRQQRLRTRDGLRVHAQALHVGRAIRAHDHMGEAVRIEDFHVAAGAHARPIQVTQESQRLPRQARLMVGLVGVDPALPALHPLPRDDPFALLPVDLNPRCLDERAGPDEHQQHQSHRDPRGHARASLVCVQRARSACPEKCPQSCKLFGDIAGQ